MELVKPGTDIIFMVEPGYVEWQAILLSCSIREHKKCEGKITGYCREEKMGDLKRETVQLLKKFNIDIVPITNPFSPAYPQGNKVAACLQHKNDGPTLFLDTDMMIMRDVYFSEAFSENSVSMAKATATWNAGEDHLSHWETAYRACGVEPALSLAKGGRVTDYYNAGFVLYDGATSFSENWMECCLTIDGLDVPNRRPWLDQIALPIAARKSELGINALDRKWNRALNNDVPLKDNAIVVHYHTHRPLRRHGCNEYANVLLKKYTTFRNLAVLRKNIQPDLNYVKK